MASTSTRIFAWLKISFTFVVITSLRSLLRSPEFPEKTILPTIGRSMTLNLNITSLLSALARTVVGSIRSKYSKA